MMMTRCELNVSNIHSTHILIAFASNSWPNHNIYIPHCTCTRSYRRHPNWNSAIPPTAWRPATRMRRRHGLGAIQKQKLEAEKFKDKTTELQDVQFDTMTKQMDVFRSNLEEFAAKHKAEIRKNPQFRRQFQEMCAAIGVDPLASGKGVWSVLGMGDFYFELSVQVVEVCLAANHSTGGYMELSELRRRLVAARGRSARHQEITEDDLLIAAKKLRIFGNGFRVYPIGRGRHMVQSVPGELSLQETSVLEIAAAQPDGKVSKQMLMKELSWNEFRTTQALDKIVGDGLAWIDDQDTPEKTYWFASLFPQR